MKLYATTTSAFVRKVLVVARERGLVDRIETITLRPSPLRADPDLSRANPLNKIPALVLDDGTTLYDSTVISEYLDGIGDAPRLVPAAGPARWDALRRQALGDGILEAGVAAFYERAQRPASHQWQPWVDGQLEKVRQGLDAVDAELARAGDVPVDLGWITLGVAVGWLAFREVVDPLAGRPALATWYGAFAERPSMRATAPR